MPAALEAHDLTKEYRLQRALRDLVRLRFAAKKKPALTGLSLTLNAGERLALVGPNGAGKTTLARIACGVVLPDSGTALVAGEPTDRGHRWRAHVGFARPDDPALHPRLNPLECLRFHAALYGRTLDRAQLMKALERVDAVSLAAQRVQTLSGGEKAKVSLAKALLHEPKLLILDEISRVLDPGAAARTRALLIEYAKAGGAVLLITHDLVEAALCDRVAVVEAGKVLADGSWSQVEAKAKEVFKL
ncbi:MAG TPA: ABC transporter ATP-binding protein [Myxococcales bacterium]|jgi:ABC-2 type transport system ATP-binding protein